MKTRILVNVIGIILIISSGNSASAVDYANINPVHYVDLHDLAIGYYYDDAKDTIFVGDRSNGLQLIDISKGLLNATKTTLFPTTQGRNTNGAAHTPFVEGNYAYVPNGYGFYVLDVSSSEIEVKSYTDTTHAIYANVKGNTLYLSDGNSNALKVYDITDRRIDPELVQTVDIAAFPEESLIYQNWLILATGTSGVEVFDISDPTNIVSQSVIPTGDATFVYLDYPTLYVATKNNGIEIVDVSNFNSPSIIGNIPGEGESYGVTTNGTTLFAGFGNDLNIYDISNLDSISLIHTHHRGGRVHNIEVHGEYLVYLERNLGLIIMGEGSTIFPNPITSSDSTSTNISQDQNGDDGSVPILISPLLGAFVIIVSISKKSKSRNNSYNEFIANNQ